MGFEPVTVYPDWGDFDSLAGYVLEDGESLWLRFGDGTEVPSTVKVDRTVSLVSDMGKPSDYPTMIAFVTLNVHGSDGLVRLHGPMLRRRKGRTCRLPESRCSLGAHSPPGE